jgi:hypothetical protein
MKWFFNLLGSIQTNIVLRIQLREARKKIKQQEAEINRLKKINADLTEQLAPNPGRPGGGF